MNEYLSKLLWAQTTDDLISFFDFSSLVTMSHMEKI